MYTIKHAAEQLGVSVSTLRAWETRYGIGPARRTDAGYRIYDESSLRTLGTMNALVLDGWSVRAAAEETLRRAAAATTLEARALDDDWSPDDRDALVTAAEAMDPVALSRVLDHRFAAASFETVVDSWLMPALAELGSAWESGRISVAAEHLVSHAVARRLGVAYDAAGATAGPPVVLGLAPGSRHDLGLLSFATAARRAGLATAYLGADVPVDDWATMIDQHDAACIVLALPMEEDVPGVTETVRVLEDCRPSLLVAVGGAAQDRAPDRCLRLGHRIGPAAALLSHALGRRVEV
ncbi:MerR family transcriptional regulator [Nocardioides stalactiti]|uniref:MerR family transcriptional regulator n=1 Tax=Nocardioides stalactiti TaxID=2755356 RepID=UPI00160059FD|nr:MerR family transcriptional regulator [Nocardioides stalactiti]